MAGHLENLDRNKDEWKARFAEYEELKNAGNNTQQQVPLSTDPSRKQLSRIAGESPVESLRGSAHGSTSII